MVITKSTKIAHIIKENKDSIDAIASLSKPLAKLKNPILRKVLAARVTLAEAAKIGGTTVEKMAEALQPLGFEFQESEDVQEKIKVEEPDWLQNLTEDRITKFDVRQMLEGGVDPLKEIMIRFKEIPDASALCVIVGFEPIPLIARLTKNGRVKAFSREISSLEFNTFFYKLPESEWENKSFEPIAKHVGKPGEVFHDTEEDFKNLCAGFDEAHTKTIDVRHLEMPGPRITILGELEKLPSGTALYVYHKRIPVYLLEDLSEMEFEVHIWSVEEKDVRLLLFKAL